MKKYMKKFFIGVVVGFLLGMSGSFVSAFGVSISKPAILPQSDQITLKAPEAPGSIESQLVKLNKKVSDLDARVSKLEAKK